MRGVAALAAACAVWVLVVGGIPSIAWRVPKIRLRVVAGALFAGALAAIIAYGLLGTRAPALAIGVLCSAIPARFEFSRLERRERERTDQWPDFLAHLRSSVAAGATLPDSFVDAADRIGGDFKRYAIHVREEVMYGAGFDAALFEVRSELQDPIADRVLATLMIAHGSGGRRVGDVLAALGASVADEIRLRKAHDAALTEQRWTATVALIAPWALLALSIATNPQAAETFDTPEGMVVVAGGFVATSLGWILARRAARLSAAPRLFT
ncbi:MAG: type II secretion system F family protein [Actinomycetota bacterium]|nr:type II secretion system F family protein [Actinomycetota bacterium]